MFDALKELAYGASHEINNPLANISTRAQTLLKQETDPEKRRMLAAIHTQAMRAHEMIADLMFFARPPALSYTRFDLMELLQRIVAEMAPQGRLQNTELLLKSLSPATRENRQSSATVAEGKIELPIEADMTQIPVAVRALIQNSLESLGSDGHIEVIASVAKDQITITVADDGPGIPPEVRKHIFEPFFSGREAGRGLGFGLGKCWRIITEHGGRIEVMPASPRGTIFKLLLPSVAKESNAH